ncbi:rlmE [Symbiodinium natans]|uniref:RlmE protein n=1 Tax=Symbiodinium natans TaxID=878477 RepID=A0A812S6Y6_9DINO|nr:rlmE [Symbiodinium natans]
MPDMSYVGMEDYDEYGPAVGCQAVEILEFNYRRRMPATNCIPADSPECISGTWYSLPGACPSKSLYKKTDECKQEYPSAQCDSPDGTSSCTYNTRYAGLVELDELVGIKDYEKWWANKTGPTGNFEYNRTIDMGNGTTWWNDRHSESLCDSRIEQVIDLFAKRYPQLPKDLPDPPCL